MDNYIISDIHFSKTKGLGCIADPMEEFIDILKIDKNEKRVIIGGDYFDQYFDTSDIEYIEAIKYLKQLAENCDELVILYGTTSHDRSNYAPILPLLPSHVSFFKTIGVFNSKLNSDRFLMIPEEYPEDFAEYYKDYVHGEGGYDLVIGHGNIDGAQMNKYIKIDNNRLGGRTFNKDDLGNLADEVFFGHIHLRQELRENVQYIGSMNKTGFGEEDEIKGFWVYNSEHKKKEFRPLLMVHEFKDITIGEYDMVDKHTCSGAPINYRILTTAETSEDEKAKIKKIGVKTKRVDKTVAELLRESDESKLKYEGMAEASSLREQFMIAFEADKKNNKSVKQKILVEIKSRFN